MRFHLAVAAAALTTAVQFGLCQSPVPSLQPSTQPAVDAAKPMRTRADLAQRVQALANTIATLPPDQAADQWLKLVDDGIPILQSRMDTERFVFESQFAPLTPAMPTPAQWPALLTEAKKQSDAQPYDKRAKISLCFAAALVGDHKTANKALDDLVAIVRRKFPGVSVDDILRRTRKSLNDTPGDPQAAVAAFEDELDHSDFISDVPDLVTLAGPEKAETLLRKALMSKSDLEISVGDETRALARKLALSMANELPRPQWALCEDINAVALYEAMEKRENALKHPTTQNAKHQGWLTILGILPPAREERFDFDDYRRKEARNYYMLGLIVAGRTDDAVKVAEDRQSNNYIPSDAIDAMEQVGQSENLYAFFKRLAQDDPGTPYWNEFTSLASKLDKSAEVLPIIQAEFAKKDLAPEVHWEVTRRMANAWLALDKLDDGLKLLRGQVAQALDKDKFAPALQLATIGRIVGRPELTKEGLDAIAVVMPKLGGIEASQSRDWAREMAFAGRSDEVVTLLTTRLAQPRAADINSYDNENAPGLIDLRTLAAMYYAKGDPQAVIDLANKCAAWPVKDAAALNINELGHDAPVPVPFYLAWALAKTGTIAEAERMLDVVFDKCGGLDAAYALLLQIDPNAIAKLDTLASRDRFEERPLIWKAVLLHQAGKLDDAERVCREAIAIDPSDGEEGKGDRMRVYAVLAEVLQDKGNAKDAEFYRQVVQSIREAEDADDVWNAGLSDRAVKMYADSLTHFSDAYCIQSRLAVHLAELGNESEAEIHYRKAYELMPGSFGRVESHCFGCERAFAGKVPQSIAERVFTQMLAKDPKKPQLHYLLGYLRSEQNREVEAAAEFKAATQLDPDYLNAWKKLLECAEHAQLPPADIDAAVLNELRLDPLERHSNTAYELRSVQDLAQLWSAAEAAVKMNVDAPTTLLPFPAAAARINQLPKTNEMTYSSNERRPTSPGGYLLKTNRFQSIADLYFTFPE